MRKVILALIIIVTGTLLTGCKISHQYDVGDVSEIVTTQKSVSQNTTKGDTGKNSEFILQFVDDSHFYEQDELDFTETLGSTYHIKVLDVYATDKLEELGEYFVGIESEFAENRSQLLESEQCALEDYIYVAVTIELTNKEKSENTFCLADLGLKFRIKDDSMESFGVGTWRLSGIEGEYTDSELFFDYENREIDKSYYMVNFKPEETIKTKVVFGCDKNLLQENMYLRLGMHSLGTYDSRKGEWIRSDDAAIKFLRLKLDEE